MSNVRYTAYVLDDSSRRMLEFVVRRFRAVPFAWKVFNDHMTICLGSRDDINYIYTDEVVLEVDAVACDNGVAAARVCNVNRYDEEDEVTPHITFACDIQADKKPQDAKELKDWTTLPFKVLLRATLKEVK